MGSHRRQADETGIVRARSCPPRRHDETGLVRARSCPPRRHPCRARFGQAPIDAVLGTIDAALGTIDAGRPVPRGVHASLLSGPP